MGGGITSSLFVNEQYSDIPNNSYVTKNKLGYYPLCCTMIYTSGTRATAKVDQWAASQGTLTFRVIADSSVTANMTVKVLWIKTDS